MKRKLDMLNKKEIKAHKLAIQYMYSGNHFEAGKAVSEASNMGQKFYSMFLKYAEIDIYRDGLAYYKTIGDRAHRLEHYFENKVLLKSYQDSNEDVNQFTLCRLLAGSSDEELAEMEALGILVPGVTYPEIVKFLKMKDAEKQAVAV